MPKIPTIKTNSNVNFTSKEKANIFAETFQTKFTKHEEDRRFPIKPEIDNFNIPNIDPNPPTLTPDTVAYAIDEDKVGKSPGYDSICYRILRSLNVNTMNFLTF